MAQPYLGTRNASGAALAGGPPEAPTGGSLPAALYGHPMSVFLSPKYRSLCLFPQELKTEEERQERATALQQLRAQKAVEGFVKDGCCVRAATMGVGGGILGILFGAFFFTMKPVEIDSSLGFRAQLREQYRHFVPEVKATAKNFAKIGAIYSMCECLIDRVVRMSSSLYVFSCCMYLPFDLLSFSERATHDFRGAVYAGCFTGALLAMKGGPRAMAGGCLAFGAFSGVMELLQPFAGFE